MIMSEDRFGGFFQCDDCAIFEAKRRSSAKMKKMIVGLESAADLLDEDLDYTLAQLDAASERVKVRLGIARSIQKLLAGVRKRSDQSPNGGLTISSTPLVIVLEQAIAQLRTEQKDLEAALGIAQLDDY